MADYRGRLMQKSPNLRAGIRDCMLRDDTSFFYALLLPVSGQRALYRFNAADPDNIPSVEWLLYEATDADLLALPGFGRTSLARFREAVPEIRKARGDRGRLLSFPARMIATEAAGPLTRVVHLRREPYDVRIDRRSKWGNPFEIPKPERPGDRDRVIAQYREYILGEPQLLADLPELRGKRLGCWCKPLACHGDVLVELLERDAPTHSPAIHAGIEGSQTERLSVGREDVIRSGHAVECGRNVDAQTGRCRARSRREDGPQLDPGGRARGFTHHSRPLPPEGERRPETEEAQPAGAAEYQDVATPHAAGGSHPATVLVDRHPGLAASDTQKHPSRETLVGAAQRVPSR